ncbi:MAG: efflux RND transporter periplasmic adaptor subunit [Rubritepida sp.]|jgi:RND family efflux transporter MFP subunit|nr:efflux RND transporter periplasmic adaptor subunit [Rubritepida sp.]
MKPLPLMLTAALLAACDGAPPPAAEAPRPVRVVAAEPRTGGETVSLAGIVQPQSEVQLAFRIPGRMVERLANVGERVQAGQVLARLDRANEENTLRSARAALLAAEAALVEARNDHWRQAELLRSGFTTRARYDQATQRLQAATSQVESTQANYAIARDRVGYTELYADAPGIVTARRAEQGDVVAAGQPIFVLAREDGRDAVFAVPAALKDAAPANPRVTVFLTTDPGVRAMGRVREVSPSADPVTGAFEVRVGLTDPPAGLRLGSTVTGQVTLADAGGIDLPAGALFRAEGQPAVWVVEPRARTVALRPVEVARHDSARVVVARGLERGDLVVTAGVQALRPGQTVRLLGE